MNDLTETKLDEPAVMEWLEELGFETGLHRTYIGMIERGEKNITLKNIEKIARALKASIDDLMGI